MGGEEAFCAELEERAAEVARKAGALLLNRYGSSLKVEFKDARGTDPVSEADRASQELVRESVARWFPDHAILGEEGLAQGDEGAEYVWVVDPLDGTKNFLSGVPLWGFSVAVLQKGEPVAGALFTPWERDPAGALFRARRGGGARQGGEPIRVSSGGRPEGKRLSCLPAAYWAQFTPLAELRRGLGEVRALGSFSYELAAVARGAVQLSLLGSPSVWDAAAGVLLVREAGGEILARKPRTNEWHPLLRFGPGANRPPRSLKDLRLWRQSLLAANPELARFVAARLRVRARRMGRRGVVLGIGRRRHPLPPR